MWNKMLREFFMIKEQTTIFSIELNEIPYSRREMHSLIENMYSGVIVSN